MFPSLWLQICLWLNSSSQRLKPEPLLTPQMAPFSLFLYSISSSILPIPPFWPYTIDQVLLILSATYFLKSSHTSTTLCRSLSSFNQWAAAASPWSLCFCSAHCQPILYSAVRMIHILPWLYPAEKSSMALYAISFLQTSRLSSPSSFLIDLSFAWGSNMLR